MVKEEHSPLAPAVAFGAFNDAFLDRFWIRPPESYREPLVRVQAIGTDDVRVEFIMPASAWVAVRGRLDADERIKKGSLVASNYKPRKDEQIP